MVQPKTFEVSGRKYQVIPHTGFGALQLDRKVSGIAMQSFGVLGAIRKEKGLTAIIPMIGGIARSLQDLSNAEYEEIVSLTFERTVELVDGAKDIPLTGETVGDRFQGRFIDFYTCMYKVWEANELSPFGIMERFGNQITPTQP